ncbi:MAG TPA: fibronectin type III domain-containing protein, partial [Gallionella sp.]|nr:fibronectin type III domain-containing protein [Gallionella sp.]
MSYEAEFKNLVMPMKPALLLLAFVSTLFISACGGGGSTASPSAATVPLAPVGVTATTGDAQIQLGWAAVSGATSYNVYYRTSAGVTAANGTKIASATSGGPITGLTNGTTYYFVVTAVNAAGESAVSSEVNATPQVSTPGAPTGVGIILGDGQVSVTWTAVTGATSYNIYYRATAGVTTTNGTKVAGVASGFPVTGLTNGTTYYFVVTAVNAGGESAASSEVNAMPQVPTPGAPTGVGATAGNAQVKVSWTAVPGAVSYNVYYLTIPGVTAANGTKESLAASGLPITGLANGTTYYFVVTAVNAGGESAVSSEVNATPQVPPGAWTTKAPMVNQRDNAANAVLNGIIYVMGGAPAGVGVLDSMEAYDPVANTWTTKAPMPAWSTIPSVPSWAPPGTLAARPAYRYGPAAAAANGVIYLIGGTSLVNGQGPIYPIAVYDPTINAAGGGTWSSTVPTTAATSAAGTSGQALAPFPTGRWGFDVAVVDGIIYAVGGAVRVPGGITKAPSDWTTTITGATSLAPLVTPAGTTITGLTNGKTYYFIVTAVDATSGIESADSFEVSATPQASYAAGSVPANLGTAAGNGQATISWTEVTGAASYNIYYGTKSGVTTSSLTKVTGIVPAVGTVSATVTGLTNGTAHYFIVTAMVGGAETVASSEVSATPRAAPVASAPSGVSITGGNGQVTLSWAPVANAASYNIYYGTCKNLYYGTVEAYDPVANTWTTKTSMTPRWGSAVSVVNGLIYAIGGWGGWPELSVVEVYNPATNLWSTTVPVTAATTVAGTAGAALTPMPTARDDFGFAVVNGIIYAIGGDINAFNDAASTPCCTTVVEAYDPVKNNWTTKTPMPTMRDDFDASVVDGVIYAIAGSRDGVFTVNSGAPNNGGYSLTTVEAFSTSSIPVPGGVAAAAGVNLASISWNAVAGATSYNIYWSKKAGVSTTANST